MAEAQRPSHRPDQKPWYQYEPLDESKPSVRLLTIHPDDGSELIKCSLANCHLDSQLRYHALSYEWGDDQNLRDIDVDGQRLSIRSNLWHFLKEARALGCQNPDLGSTLWIDAVCINQTDNQEKTHQVALMCTIYRYASRVLVWLGVQTCETEHVRKLFSIAKPRFRRGRVRQFYRKHSASIDFCLNDLCTRSYWRRVWIVQEWVLAQRVSIVCGNHFVDWKLFWRVCNMTLRITPMLLEDRMIEEKYRPIANLYHNREFREITDRQRLHDYVASFRENESTHPLDHVYAFLGVATDIEDPTLFPIMRDVNPTVVYFDLLRLNKDWAIPSAAIMTGKSIKITDQSIESCGTDWTSWISTSCERFEHYRILGTVRSLDVQRGCQKVVFGSTDWEEDDEVHALSSYLYVNFRTVGAQKRLIAL